MASKMDRLTPYPVTRRHVLGLPLVLAGVARPLDTLQGQAARRGITYGGAVAYDHLHDPAFRAAVLREMADASALFARNLANFLIAFWAKEQSRLALPDEDEIVAAIRLTRGGDVVHKRLKTAQ